jgi:hypothetical protein
MIFPAHTVGERGKCIIYLTKDAKVKLCCLTYQANEAEP